ncbi:hypothetical protein AB0P19_02390 [Microbacterium oleivorans]|uniref:hypothetical protein n=1 Tax=Microbacterium oleivorans TaxID=273677 RepID=UPI00342DDAA0
MGKTPRPLGAQIWDTSHRLTPARAAGFICVLVFVTLLITACAVTFSGPWTFLMLPVLWIAAISNFFPPAKR